MADTNIQYYTNQQITLESENQDRKISLGSAVGRPQGITIEYDRLTTPKLFTISPAGVEWNDGTSTYTTGLGRLSAVQEALQAVELPPNATTLKLNDTCVLTDGTANQITIDGGVPSITITDGTNTNTITATGGGGGSQDLNSVLSNGNNANSQNITNVSDLGCSTINGVSYPPPTPSLSAVLASGNDATGYDILNVSNLSCSTINGLTPTTIGLTWANFNGADAQANLPNGRYEVGYSGSSTYQDTTNFNITNSGFTMNMNNSTIVNTSSGYEYMRYDYNSAQPFLRLGYNAGAGSSIAEYGNGYMYNTQFSYGTNYNWEGRWSMEADAGLHIRSNETTTNTLKPILFEGSGLYLNGSLINTTPYVACNASASGTTSWSISSGSFQSVISGIPLTFPAGLGWSGYKDFLITLTFNNYTGVENTAVLYMELRDSFGTTSQPYSNNVSYPTANTNINSFTGSSTQFNYSDRISLNNTTGSTNFFAEIFLGHNGSTWSGSGIFSITLTAI